MIPQWAHSAVAAQRVPNFSTCEAHHLDACQLIVTTVNHALSQRVGERVAGDNVHAASINVTANASALDTTDDPTTSALDHL
uniref:Uncharacterized protein n=1 Tax=Ascaris lumbricoides TaxID=6252 RepID=A0A9J2PCT9_ASCLU